MRLKISVLASGTVLLDGRPVDTATVDAALNHVQQSGGQVWLYRETPGKTMPVQGTVVIQNLVRRNLPISLSSKPDFSDWVDAKGVSHPRTSPAGELPIPEVSIRSDIAEVFARLREAAAGGLAILKPDRTHIVIPRMPSSPEMEDAARTVERLIPRHSPRHIAAIASTVFEGEEDGAAGFAAIADAIPFLGMLVGMSYIGHAVWVFEGHEAALAAGTHMADVLLVDSALRTSLRTGWEDGCAKAMRNPNVLLYQRAGGQLALVRRAGPGEGLHFPNTGPQ